MQWASRSPVTPLPAASTSSRQRPVAALRQVRGDRPVLQELGAVVEDAAELALVDELLGERDRRARGGSCTRPCSARRPSRPPRPSPRLRRRSSASGFSQRIILPALAAAMAISCVQCCSACRCRWRRCPCARPASASRSRSIRSPTCRRTPCALSASRAQTRLQHRLVRQVEEVADLAVGVRVRPAHEAVADHADVERFHGHRVSRCANATAASRTHDATMSRTQCELSTELRVIRDLRDSAVATVI